MGGPRVGQARQRMIGRSGSGPAPDSRLEKPAGGGLFTGSGPRLLRRGVRGDAWRASVLLPVTARPAMTLCPVALTAGCRKCPIFSVPD